MASLELDLQSIEQCFDFHHFDTFQQCDNYIRNNPHIQVSHTCCDGTGVAIVRVSRIHKMIPTKQETKFIPIEGTCDICFLENTDLYNTCKTCNHPFCKDCLIKLKNKICPCCRGELESFP
jgi:hypothetical protein